MGNVELGHKEKQSRTRRRHVFNHLFRERWDVIGLIAVCNSARPALYPYSLPGALRMTCFAHDTANSLNNIDLGVSRVEEQNPVKARTVDAFGEAFRVRENPARVRTSFFLEPIQTLGPFEDVESSVDVFSFHPQLRLIISAVNEEFPSDLLELVCQRL